MYYGSKETGWVGSEKLQFMLTISTIYADIGWFGEDKKIAKNVLT